MLKVKLFNKAGQKSTEVNIRTNNIKEVDAVQYGTRIFAKTESESDEFHELEVNPAIIRTKKK